ncbi:TetR/AcrR family transcriptional regulator [Acerihabitans sp. TG2]|uniref:TetR/AcrR family transcriptional regulator n=1 Tax=Acerihabitans sp. TG2 TaxID=3096008 RepID=UPI002B22AAD9|nr:TetR/AcrR family transcriptional regulator [Acerihabitans sp. TG2]MEA9391572.1 TetR/AcrR family transcriptional regulator [Acerihabitans sp. TG2]
MATEHKDVRQHILDTGKRVIVGKGFSAVGLSEILGAAKVPKGSFYHYFKSKESFGEALLQDYFTDYNQRLQSVLTDRSRTAAARLMTYWQCWQETQEGDDLTGKCLVVKLSAEVSDLSEIMREALKHGTENLLAQLSACIAEGIQDGSLSADLIPEHSALALYELWLGATLLTKLRRDSSALDQAMLTTLRLLQLSDADMASH